MKTPTQEQINEALALCRKTWADHPEATHALCCHHGDLYEKLTEPAEVRIDYILRNKSRKELVIRFNNFRPVTRQTEWEPLEADYRAKREPLDADYLAKREALDADYWAKSLEADYRAKCEVLDADYRARCEVLDADYWAKREALDADYWAKREVLYRADVPLGTWNGKSIFSTEEEG